jgi:hypothetical protein
MTGRAVVVLALAACFATVAGAAQQPPAAPQPPADAAAQAGSDLRTLGQEHTRRQAERWLRDAMKAFSQLVQPIACDNRTAQDLHYAVLYYAAAHGLPGDVDALVEMYESMGNLSRSDAPVNKRWLWESFGIEAVAFATALYDLQRLKQAAGIDPCPTPRGFGVLPAQAGGGSKKTLLLGGAAGVVAVSGLVLAGGGDGDGAQPPQVNLTPNFGPWNGSVTYTLTSGCSRQGVSFVVTVTLSGNADGTGFALEVQGHRYVGTLRSDGSFEASYTGVFTFPGLFNSSGTSTLTGNLRQAGSGREMTAAGPIRLTGGPCADNQTQVSLIATKN